MPVHPYYPVSLKMANYVAPQYNTLQILVPFFSAVAIILLTSVLLIRSRKHTLTNSPLTTKSIYLWFVLCGFIHCFIEGYYAANVRDIAGQTTFLAECWKEYSLSDSRYMTVDSFVWMMESITAFAWGPLSFVTAYMIYKDSPSRHLFQFGISFGQFYGDVLYYSTTLVEGAAHTRPEPFYFWFYFGLIRSLTLVFLNAFWIIIPVGIMISSGKVIIQALAIAKTNQATLKAKKTK